MAPGFVLAPEMLPVTEKAAKETDMVMRMPVARIKDNVLFLMFSSPQSMRIALCIVL